MGENTFYKCIVKVENENSKGKIVYTREEYIVEAISPTDVETKLTEELQGTDFEIASIIATKILKIIK